eukprot:c7180_g1_i1.p1 GENE.c7180_g1_i1~~c7180_g1_i1.p1  ORF type:complete len:351 (+),score=82.16 c7180_g1_i1:63-1115(+)
MALPQAQTDGDFQAAVQAAKSNPILVHFSASWCEPCTQVDQVVAQLCKTFPTLAAIKVEAEDLAETSLAYHIESVPTCVLVLHGVEQSRITGFDPAGLTKQITDFFSGNPTRAAPPASSPAPKADPAPAPAPATSSDLPPELSARLQALVNKSAVMIFIKGTPDEPRCGFSSKAVALLRENHILFESFDILQDETVRQGLKTFSNWPTFPQIYVKGELVGGLDLVKEQLEDGSLLAMIPDEARQDKLEQKLKDLIHQSPVMLFMKGDPTTPRCGFSRQIVDLLNGQKVKFGSFDILSDESVRQGLKDFSKWPTYPQLYINGELMGGLDLVREQIEAGEFLDAVPQEARLG